VTSEVKLGEEDQPEDPIEIDFSAYLLTVIDEEMR
jgi:hypothetical protein